MSGDGIERELDRLRSAADEAGEFKRSLIQVTTEVLTQVLKSHSLMDCYSDSILKIKGQIDFQQKLLSPEESLRRGTYIPVILSAVSGVLRKRYVSWPEQESFLTSFSNELDRALVDSKQN